jgi:hypothetical protein
MKTSAIEVQLERGVGAKCRQSMIDTRFSSDEWKAV